MFRMSCHRLERPQLLMQYITPVTQQDLFWQDVFWDAFWEENFTSDAASECSELARWWGIYLRILVLMRVDFILPFESEDGGEYGRVFIGMGCHSNLWFQVPSNVVIHIITRRIQVKLQQNKWSKIQETEAEIHYSRSSRDSVSLPNLCQTRLPSNL